MDYREIELEILDIINDTLDFVNTGFRNRNRKRISIPADTSIDTNRNRVVSATENKDIEGYNDNSSGAQHKKAPEESAPVGKKERPESIVREKRDKLNMISRDILECKKCPLHEGRINPVPGEGNPDADIMFIGEGPGEMEDLKGRPFVGRAGKLLTKMLESINLTREEVYITNIVKCRPPNNRTPAPEEVATCFPYLEKQIEIIQPLIICCLGGPAAKALLKTREGITKLRGTIHRYKDIPVIPTYHPAAVLRFRDKYARPVWNDLKMLRDLYKELKTNI